MDNHMSEMGAMYEQILKEGQVKKGESFEGADKAQGKSIKGEGPETAKLPKPQQGPSMGDDTVAQGKGVEMKKKAVKATEQAATQTLSLSFDDLFNKVINEADDDLADKVVPAPDVEGDDFSEDTGDFDATEETDVDEEVDLASELRLLADRLSEIADKLSVEDEGEEDGDLGDEMGDEMGADDATEDATEDVGMPPALNRESVQTEAIKSEPTPKPLKKTTLGPKMKQNPTNKIGKSGAGKASLPAQGKDRSGKPSNAKKTTLGPKMSQNPSGTGPAVKGAQSPLIA